MSAQVQRPVYATGPWAVDLGRRELRKNGRQVPIGDRAFEIIEVLVLSAGQLVTKRDIMGRVWAGSEVEENTLQVHVSAVRRAFGPDRGMLKTSSGRGYRLLGAWTIRGESSPAVAHDAKPGSVPVQPFSTNFLAAAADLIGRDTDVARLRDLLSAYRVVTLTGPGGIGKTRLAQEVALSLSGGFPDGTWLIELASLADPALVPSAVARVLGLEIGADTISPASIAQGISGRRILLLLDNCEHVIGTAAGLVEAVVRVCPRAYVLATSRELLGVDGEHAFRVAPLDVPGRNPAAPDDVLRHGAVQLFVARTRALRSDFSPGEEDFSSIGAICRRLDGIPLAIEFAAARVATLGVEQVLSRLDDRFELLTGGRRTALPRHRTLRATLDWSYDLLPEAERTLLRRLAVFVAGFTPEAALAAMSDTGTTATIVMAGIASLVAKSLITLDAAARTGRWRMLETIRAYAMEKVMESGEADQAARSHAEFFRDWFAPAVPASSSQPVERMTVFGQEIDNVRAAINWAFSGKGDASIGVVLTAAYLPMWMHLSFDAECRERIEQALNRIDTDPAMSARLKLELHVNLGSALVHATGSADLTETVLVRALDAAESLNEVEIQLRVLWAMWNQRINNGENRASEIVAERFLRVAERHGDPADVHAGTRLMGNVMHYRGDQQQARSTLERMLDQYVTTAAQRHSAWFFYDQRVLARAILARVLWLQGFIDQANQMASSSLAEARTADHSLSVCHVLGTAVCPIALMTGDLPGAERSVAMLMDLVKAGSITFWAKWGPCLEAHLLISRGEFEKGAALLRTALETRGRSGWSSRIPEWLGILAEGLAGAGETTEALATIDEALAESARNGRNWYDAELLRLKGEVLLRQVGDGSPRAGEDCFQEALTAARRHGALSWELRAALSLARLWVCQDRRDEGRQILARVYDRFTEGFETADLRSARALLDSLA